MYYEIIGDSQNSYTRYIFLNEMVSGQDINYIDNLFLREKEHPLRFDQNNCYICLLGLKKEVYSGFYGLTTNKYMEIYICFEHKIADYIQNHGYKGEIFLHLYADKQIIIIYSKTELSNVSPIQIAEYAQDCLQLLYFEQFLYDRKYCNQTYYYEEAINRQQLTITLKKLIELSKLRFFIMKPVVLTTKMVDKLHKKLNESDISEIKQKIITAINIGNLTEYKILFEDLMLNKIKYSFNFYTLQDVTYFFKIFYLECCSSYGIPQSDNVDLLFDYRNYEKIETLTENLFLMFQEIIDKINIKGKKYSQLTQKSLRILHTSFYKTHVSAGYIARQVNVSPSYLSSVFNSEVEMSISQYLTNLRIEKAKKLLEETNKLITDISNSVGYSNKRYFTQVFKQKLGCTPKEYRETFISKNFINK